MKGTRRAGVAAIALGVLAVGSLGPLGALAGGNVGYPGPAYDDEAGSRPTGSKPESKLWWNDGYWWASMWDRTANDFYIWKLDLGSRTWRRTETVLDPNGATRADVLWDGRKLYVASHKVASTGSPTANLQERGRLFRYSYDARTDRYTRDAGYPAQINGAKTETLVIAKDSTGRLWATWVQQTSSGSGFYRVYVNRTLTPGVDNVWGTPFKLPNSLAGSTMVTPDDISSLVAFQGTKIGLMWTNQATHAAYFAIHLDRDGPMRWGPERVAIQGPREVDDHLNLKSVQSAGGRVYAAVKSSQTALSAPLVRLLVRDPVTGAWAGHTYGRKADDHSRPIVLLDVTNQRILMYASDEGGGSIHEKVSDASRIWFSQGKGTVFSADGVRGSLDDATSTKQNVSCRTGLVVLSSDRTTHRYWFNYRAIPGC